MSDTRHGIDLTEGRVSGILLRFAFPFMLANLVTAVNSAVGMLIVGRFTNQETIAGVATGLQLMNPVLAFMSGIGTGITVLIGKRIGEKDDAAGRKAVGSSFIASLAVMILVTVFTWVLREPLLDLLGTQPEARPSASRYVAICTIGVPLSLGYAMISAIFRGLGNSRIPSLVAGVSCVINFTLSFLLVGAFGMDEDGVAYALVAAQASSFILIALLLYKKKFPFPFAIRDNKPDMVAIKHIAVVGIPMVLQDLTLTAAFMIITNRVNSISVVASAAVGVVTRAANIVLVLPAGIGSAVAAMTAQNLGAAKHDRAIQSLRWGIQYALMITVCLFLFCMIKPMLVMSLFTTDSAVIEAASYYLRGYALEMVMVSFIFCLNSYLSGCGKSNVTMIHTIVSVLCIRAPLSVLFAQLQGITLGVKLVYLGISGSIASIFSIIVCFVYIFWQQRKLRRLA